MLIIVDVKTDRLLNFQPTDKKGLVHMRVKSGAIVPLDFEQKNAHNSSSVQSILIILLLYYRSMDSHSLLKKSSF
jgi:hypothetical protein